MILSGSFALAQNASDITDIRQEPAFAADAEVTGCTWHIVPSARVAEYVKAVNYYISKEGGLSCSSQDLGSSTVGASYNAPYMFPQGFDQANTVIWENNVSDRPLLIFRAVSSRGSDGRPLSKTLVKIATDSSTSVVTRAFVRNETITYSEGIVGGLRDPHTETMPNVTGSLITCSGGGSSAR
jgi:hypothetical protein